jgi:hypothetical protein
MTAKEKDKSPAEARCAIAPDWFTANQHSAAVLDKARFVDVYRTSPDRAASNS